MDHPLSRTLGWPLSRQLIYSHPVRHAMRDGSATAFRGLGTHSCSLAPSKPNLFRARNSFPAPVFQHSLMGIPKGSSRVSTGPMRCTRAPRPPVRTQFQRPVSINFVNRETLPPATRKGGIKWKTLSSDNAAAIVALRATAPTPAVAERSADATTAGAALNGGITFAVGAPGPKVLAPPVHPRLRCGPTPSHAWCLDRLRRSWHRPSLGIPCDTGFTARLKRKTHPIVADPFNRCHRTDQLDLRAQAVG